MLIDRVLTALVFAPALLGVLWVGGLPLALACLALTALAAWEYLRLVFGGGEPYLSAVTYAFALALAAGGLGFLDSYMGLVVPAAVMLGFTAVLARPEPLDRSITRLGLVLLGALYTGGLLPLLYALRERAEIGLGLALMALFCTWGADTGAYFAGRFFGRHKLYPVISPGKTVEGGVGGVAAAIGVAFLIAWMFEVPIAVWALVAIGLCAGVAGAIGDLSESMLKRSVGAKDSSGLIPGHGGVLDRFDAVMFAAAAIHIFSTLAL